MTKPGKSATGEVRIVGGLWRRSKLPVLDRPGLRPTGDRLRETLFNWLGQDLSGWRVLDAFAGSGALGLEAASRGAAWVKLVERDAAAAASLRQVVTRLPGAAERVQVQAGDALGALIPDAWDLILLDPPFDAQLFEPALAAATAAIQPGGWIYLEAPRPYPESSRLALHRHLKAGATHAHLFRRNVDNSAP
ncbi:16S rRNA (guanine(966)-N(2))-methyltransferase RsmD [Inhella gelatinilytica]|uniref:16S rRNA (Guanine(966)-N(2))-methyltransferase RsmD n=1 Tax=Inhella gelatinilytica TaxID=2795030 RepID=A0A931NBV9_9BURK|nr:16S rRNA (guanine(966)-N(2))-methyltransferase RsmD [Inhella gelatinilytica]MBH9551342.1 16S rRNA (guanine(966)-N(2))-methyltransferase RsmD [Inhella gelatinilytica]